MITIALMMIMLGVEMMKATITGTIMVIMIMMKNSNDNDCIDDDVNNHPNDNRKQMKV